MGAVKRIACLANSRKLQGRCIAGREFNDGVPGAWIRPVSSRVHQEVSEYERQFSDGSDPLVLDIMKIPLLEHRPAGHQSENWLLDPEHYWRKAGQLTWLDLELLTESGVLWLNGYHTFNGLNDRVPSDATQSLRDSLRLIRVSALELGVFAPGSLFGNQKRRVQARFRFEGIDYHLWVTDPVIERGYLARPDGDYTLGEAYITVSLGELYDGFYYKFAAAIIQQGGVT